MMKIIKCDDNVMSRIPNVLGLIYEIFGEKDVVVFATLDNDKKMGFVARVGGDCVYINDKGEYTLFALDTNEELDRIRIDGYLAFMDDLYFTDENNKEYRLQMMPLQTPDIDGFDGYISFKQYDPKTDTFCEINYQQMYREVDGRTPIYGVRTQEIDAVYIDEKYKKSRGYLRGLPLPKRAKYYTKVAYENGEMGYDWIMIKDYGLAEFKANRNLITSRSKEVRYVKSSFVRFDGGYGDFWPFADQIKREEIDKIIQSYGFLSEVPSVFIDIYNGYNYTLRQVNEIITEMKRIRPILDTPEGADMGMTLRLSK